MSQHQVEALGIMVVSTHETRRGVPPFADRGFYRRLSRIGRSAGIEVIVFDPLHVDYRTSTVRGYIHDAAAGTWRRVKRSLPPVIYDRCFYSGKAHFLRYRAAAERIRNLRQVRFLAMGLSGKWQVQQMLARRDELLEYLPETRVLTDLRQITDWLAIHKACILKPNAGSHGKQIIRIRKRAARRYEVHGRDAHNGPIQAYFDSSLMLMRWLRKFIGTRKFLLQEALTLHTSSGQPFDVRSLVQKNGNGSWQLTGMAVRLGRLGSITANLHGGAVCRKLKPFLSEHFVPSLAEEIYERLLYLSAIVPDVLEAETGQLIELGLDFGIDENGKVWILEANSKPGRSVFAQLRDDRRSRASVMNLIEYARYLFQRQLGGLPK